MKAKIISFVLRDDGCLFFGENAEDEIRNFPNNVVYSGNAKSVSGVPELVSFALAAEYRFGSSMGKKA